MKKSAPHLLLILLIVAISTGNAMAQKKISRTVKASIVDLSRGTNPNVKTDAPLTDMEEPQARGAGCQVSFANYTGYYVNVYVDGYYRGQVSPWGAGTVQVQEGYTTIYCITTGKTREWKDAGGCTGKYTFKLYP